MIYDQIKNVARYRGFSRGFDVLIDWLGENDCMSLPVGLHDILGDKVFASVQEVETRALADNRFEVHRRYLDLQVDVNGREAFRVGQGSRHDLDPFDSKADFGLLDMDGAIEGDLDDGRFAVFLTGEPHMPNLQFPGDGPRAIKKVCFKILADEFFDE